VRLQSVHDDRLLAASDLDEEILEAGTDYPVWARIGWCQRRSTSSSLDIHQLSLLKAQIRRPGNGLGVSARLAHDRRHLRG
jgi:hypothetical protein